MTELLHFMGEHPFLTFFIAWLIVSLLEWPFRIMNSVIRHMNIRKAGWPPLHVDADGDFKDEDEPNTQRKED